MSDRSGYVAPIVGGVFFFAVVVAGACLYYFYLNTRRRDSEQERETANSFQRSLMASNPFVFSFTGGISPTSTSLSLFTSEAEVERSEKNLASKCSVVVEENYKLPAKIHVCRSTSYEKPLRSPCRLQVIQEMEEENEVDEEDKDADKV